MITIQEYANERGCSRQAVYSMINKHHLPTKKGISNGKSTQFLPDETVEKLNQLIRPTSKEVSTLSETLQLDLMNRESKLKDEALAAKDQTIKEISETREQMLEKIEAVSSDFKLALSDLKSDYEARLSNQEAAFTREKSEKDTLIASLRAENDSLRKELRAAQDELAYIKAHPIKSAHKIIKENKEKKNGPSAESNESSSGEHS